MTYVSKTIKPGTVIDGGGSNVWTNPSNAKAQDGVYTTNSWGSGGARSNVLIASNFPAHVPAFAIIQGIEVVFVRYGSNAATDHVSLNKAGIQTGTNKAGTDIWPSAVVDSVTYGSPTDLWGTTWTAADINNSGFGVNLSAYNTHGGGFGSVDVIYVNVYWNIPASDVPKRYIYKSYASDGTYLGMLHDVTSEFRYSQDINTAGCQITIDCAMSVDTAGSATVGLTDEAGAALTDESGTPLYTEGATAEVGAQGATNTLIKNGNRIIVTEYSAYYPSGHTVFSGTVERIEANFGGSNGDEKVTLLVYSDGADMDNYLLYGPPFAYTLDQSQTGYDHYDVFTNGTNGAGFYYPAQTFTTGAGITNVGAISLYMQGNATVTVTLYTIPNSTHALGSSTVNVNAPSATEVQFSFPSSIVVTPSTSYFFTITIAYGQSVSIYYNSVTSSYANGTMYTATFTGTSGGNYSAVNGDLYFKTASASGQTASTFTSQDPTTGMLASFMTDYNRRGGKVVYNSSNILATGLSLTASFTTNTIYEGLKTVLSLSPSGYYYYVDLSTNALVVSNASTTADFTLTMGVHITSLNLVMTIESVKNTMYFSGGVPAGGTTNLYKLYKDSDSINSYGPRIQRQSDNRVTLDATANAIGGSFITENKDEQYQTNVQLIDKQINTSAIQPGYVVGFRNTGSAFGDKLLMMVVRKEYTPEITTLTLGILPKRITAEFERLTRELIAAQTIQNPTTPS